MNLKGILKTVAALAGGYAVGRIHENVKTEKSRRLFRMYEGFLDGMLTPSEQPDLPAGFNITEMMKRVFGARKPSDNDSKAELIAQAIEEASASDASVFLNLAKAAKNTSLMQGFYDFMSRRTPVEITEYFKSMTENDSLDSYFKFMKELGVSGFDEMQTELEDMQDKYPHYLEQGVNLVERVARLINYDFSDKQYQQFRDLFSLLSEDEGAKLFNSFDRESQSSQEKAENKLLKALLHDSTTAMKQYFQELGWI